MLFFCFINTILLKYTKIHHECNSIQSDILFLQNEPVEYEINCPNINVEKVNLYFNNNIKQISIYNESNVILASSINSEKYEKLKIFDTPTILIEGNIIFKQVTIYGSPIFQFSTNSSILIENLILYNQSYKFPFNSQNIKIINNNVKKSTKDVQVMECTDYEYTLNVYLGTENAEVLCGDKNLATLNYDDFPNYKFKVFSGSVRFYNAKSVENKLSEIIEKVSPSINLYDKDKDVLFENIPNGELISSLKEYFSPEADLWIFYPDYSCTWSIDNQDIQKWRELMRNPKWKRVCSSLFGAERGMFHYCNSTNDNEKEIIIIPVQTFVYIQIGVVATLLFLLFTLFITAYATKGRCKNSKNDLSY